ncbi:MAG TPA: SIR2 family protein [Steroidobacteraceae bacterium]|nr:SIR2 family protein [Steroidobacteraceae bacterium]
MTNAQVVVEALSSFFKSSTRPVLFAGAGVSMHAGLPSWKSYLAALAEQVRANDQLSRHQMVECLAKGQYTKAADYFFLSDGLTDGAKSDALTRLLSEYTADRLLPLSALPFSAYVTTNYDRALLDAYAKRHGRAAPEVNLGDPTLASAPFQDSFYIARIHGRVEVPDTMVLSGTHYQRLYSDGPYIDFLRHLFCTRSLLIVGFSFLDPAITNVLRAIREQVGPLHAGRHTALVDSDADAEFLGELNRHNIRCIRYSSASGHAALWEGLKNFSTAARDDDGVELGAFEYARKYFAAVLTRRQMSAHMRPLKQAVAEGMVLQILQTAGTTGVSREKLAEQLADQLNITTAASETLIDSSLQGLSTDDLYETDNQGVLRAAPIVASAPGLSSSIEVLVEGAVQRLVVRDHGADTGDTRRLLTNYFEYLVLRRGWDVGAAYAARRPPQAVVVDDILSRLLSVKGTGKRPSKPLVRAVEGVLLSPSDIEATVLAELGRLAFALELVRQSPQDTLFASHVLPNRIYLDANVLMPAIVEGHPYQRLYGSAMEKLLSASAATSSGLEVCVYTGFLNEVVNHRRLATESMQEYGDRGAEFIEREVRLYGPANMNVFIAGFARTLMSGQKQSFQEFLRRYAPYSTEPELAAWLRNRGLRVIDQKQMQLSAKEYAAILHHFEKVFAQELTDRVRTATLLAHDALQIAALLGDTSRKDRAVLVTADRKLRDAVAWSEYPSLGSAMLSGVGLVQMIELLVGAIADERSIAQLLWSTKASSTAENVRRYLVDVALTQYDAALALNMESIVQEITEDVTFAIEKDAAQSRTDVEQLSLSKYVESFEPRFYEMMRAEQERLRKQQEQEDQ